MKLHPCVIQLGGLGELTKQECEIVDQVVAMLVDINKVPVTGAASSRLSHV